MSKYRVVVELDPFPDLSYLPQSQEQYDRDGHYEVDGRDVDWSEYLTTYGDVDRYDVYVVTLQKGCDSCGQWESVDSVGGCDVYDEPDFVGVYGSLGEMPEGIRWAAESHFPDFI